MVDTKGHGRLRGKAIIIYCAAFFVAWTLWEVALHPLLSSRLDTLGEVVVSNAMKLMIWTLPAVLLMQLYPADLRTPLPQALTTRLNWNLVLIQLGGFLAYNMIASFVGYGTIRVYPRFQMSTLVSTVLLVGITEEAVFRGFLLNALLRKWARWQAIVMVSILFVLVHFPSWYMQGALAVPQDALSSSAVIFVLSVIFCWSFIKEKSLVAPVALHMGWNLITMVLYGS